MPAQEKLSRNEQLLAYLAGIGIVIIVVALFLTAIGSADGDLTSSLLLVGVVVVLLAIAGWLYLLQPWRRFDDLQTPYYTGHEGHADAEAMVEADAPRGAAVLDVAPEVKAAVPEDLVQPAPIAAPPAQPPAPRGETALVASEEPEPPAPVEEAAAVIPLGEPEPPLVADEAPLFTVAPEPEPPTPTLDMPPAFPEPGAEPTPAVAPPGPDAARDDLTVIEGIGARSKGALYDAGITTFAQIAAMTPDALERAVREHNVRLVASANTWPLQAELAARQDWAGLQALIARIRGGVLHDDLTGIAGIGPQAQQALWSAGYRTLDSVAAATPDELRAAMLRSGVPDAATDTWPEQAKQLLHGAAD